MNFSFKQIDYLHPPEVIAPSIGNPTVKKILISSAIL